MNQHNTSLRGLLTRAPFVDQLIAGPGEYDAAPTYLVKAYEERSDDVRKELSKMVESPLTRTSTSGLTVAGQARIALELTAPIGYGIVRSLGLLKVAAGLVANFNPVTMVLTVPALFLTGRKTLHDLNRALSVDPKVRKHINQANALTQSGDYKSAEHHLKNALTLDINPEYRRNGDLYLQLGLVQLQDSRPREAMVSLAKASVLFGENELFMFESNGRQGKISKRGLAELLACVAIDSFTRDRDGLDEWAAVLDDFASSAKRLLEHSAVRQESGKLFGLFGIDETSAELGRELSAKVRFLSAKMRIKSASSQDQEIDELIDLALEELRAASLTSEELFNAIFEQAQFYCALLSENNDAVNAQDVLRALRLLEEAAKVVEKESPGKSAQVRAEAASFVMTILPRIVQKGDSIEQVKSRFLPLLDDLQITLHTTKQKQDFAPLALAWSEEQRYRIADEPIARTRAAKAAHALYLEAREPVAAIQNALRLAYCAETTQEREDALSLLMDAAQNVLDDPPNPISEAFAAKYMLDASEALEGRDASCTRERSAALFQKAREYVQRTRCYVSFYLHGRPVIHPWQIADIILQGLMAKELARAHKNAQAFMTFEDTRLRAQDCSNPRALQSMALELADLSIAMGHHEQAIPILESSLKQAHRDQDRVLQHRALQLMHELQHAQDDAMMLTNEPTSEVEDTLSSHTLLSHYAAKRDQLVLVCKQVLELVQRVYADKEQQTRLSLRLTRLEEDLFRVGIVGEFSAGKSTFLNALLGSRVLPASIRPTTATIVRLSWGKVPNVEIVYSDKDSEFIDFEKLNTFVTERKNPSNELRVSEVRIRYPLPILKNGIELIDTPGVSSLIESHTKTTYDLIPTCDAVLLPATARQSFSESIGDFLARSKSHFARQDILRCQQDRPTGGAGYPKVTRLRSCTH